MWELILIIVCLALSGTAFGFSIYLMFFKKDDETCSSDTVKQLEEKMNVMIGDLAATVEEKFTHFLRNPGATLYVPPDVKHLHIDNKTPSNVLKLGTATLESNSVVNTLYITNPSNTQGLRIANDAVEFMQPSMVFGRYKLVADAAGIKACATGADNSTCEYIYSVPS